MQRRLIVNAFMYEIRRHDAHFQIVGTDEMASPGDRHNSMSDHVQRLIEARHDVMRAVRMNCACSTCYPFWYWKCWPEEMTMSMCFQQVEQIDKGY